MALIEFGWLDEVIVKDKRGGWIPQLWSSDSTTLKEKYESKEYNISMRNRTFNDLFACVILFIIIFIVNEYCRYV